MAAITTDTFFFPIRRTTLEDIILKYKKKKNKQTKKR